MILSIIVPVYNSVNTIEKCIESIEGQQLSDIGFSLELIIIDDHSSDGSYELCESISFRYNNIVLCKSLKRGASAARNTGLHIANGDIIGFCDSDDYFEKNAFNNIINELQDFDICVFGIVNGGAYRASIYNTNRNTIANSKEMFERIICDRHIMGSVWNKFYKRDCIINMSFDETLEYCEDTYFNAMLFLSNTELKTKIISNPYYNYVYRKDSMTNNINNIFNENFELKYLVSLRKILLSAETFHQKAYIRKAIFDISAENCSVKLMDLQRKNLKKEMTENIWFALLLVFKFDIKKNFILILRGIYRLLF